MMEQYYGENTVGKNSRDNPSQQSEDNPCYAWIEWNDITTDKIGIRQEPRS